MPLQRRAEGLLRWPVRSPASSGKIRVEERDGREVFNGASMELREKNLRGRESKASPPQETKARPSLVSEVTGIGLGVRPAGGKAKKENKNVPSHRFYPAWISTITKASWGLQRERGQKKKKNGGRY